MNKKEASDALKDMYKIANYMSDLRDNDKYERIYAQFKTVASEGWDLYDACQIEYKKEIYCNIHRYTDEIRALFTKATKIEADYRHAEGFGRR